MSRRVVAILFCALALSSCDWAMHGFNAARTSYNASEKTIGRDNVSSLARAWSAETAGIVAAPVVAGGYAYVADIGGTVYAFAADGVDGCTGTPADCQPLWTAQLDHSALRPPTVANGVLYISAAGDMGIGGKLYAFDANGETECSGSPKVCTPLWTALNVDAFAGTTNCTPGTPTTCEPMWSDHTSGAIETSPAIADGRLYVATHVWTGVYPDVGELVAYALPPP